MGTPDFAVPTLERIISDGHEVAAVFTQPDRPKGRGMRLLPTPVKAAALFHGIEVHQPKTLKSAEAAELIKNLAPDCIVVVAYGRILPPAVLEIPRLGCVNVHASLLPRYRGAAPIQWAVVNGERESGVTTMFMAQGLDTGDMILKSRVAVGENETAGELHDELMSVGADLLSKTLSLLEKGEAPRVEQDDSQSCYAPMIGKEDADVDWNLGASAIHNLVRGMNPHPVAYTFLFGAPFKIYETRLLDAASVSADSGVVPGTVLSVGDDGIAVACGGGAILVTQVQAQSGRRMAAAAYAHGHGVKPGTVFAGCTGCAGGKSR